MSDTIERKSFESLLESDMERLASEVKNAREQAEVSREADLELVRRALKEFTPAESNPAGTAEGSPLPDTHAPPSTQLEIEYLVEIALTKGIATANAEALKASPYVLDEFHDTLAGPAYDELVRRGLLQ